MGGPMLRAFEELEKAVHQLMERMKDRPPVTSLPEGRFVGPAGGKTAPPEAEGHPSQEEVAELIRRAIKRLKSL